MDFLQLFNVLGVITPRYRRHERAKAHSQSTSQIEPVRRVGDSDQLPDRVCRRGRRAANGKAAAKDARRQTGSANAEGRQGGQKRRRAAVRRRPPAPAARQRKAGPSDGSEDRPEDRGPAAATAVRAQAARCKRRSAKADHQRQRFCRRPASCRGDGGARTRTGSQDRTRDWNRDRLRDRICPPARRHSRR